MKTSENHEQLDLETLKKRSLVGVFSLVSRSFLIQIIAFASTLFLTVFLEPGIFGVFYLVSAFVNFFSYFSDIGLAAALIQKKDKIGEEDLRTTFTLQQLLVFILLILIYILSFFAKKWYGLSKESMFLLYSLGFSFFLSSLKTIPSVLLERNLKFNLLIIPQMIETVVFNLVAVILAWKGYGISSFTYAILARGITGLVSMYLIAPWKIGLAFSKKSLMELLKFGLPYQINTIIAVGKDDLMTIVLGKIIGTVGLGYLGWAKKWSELPLRFFMDNVSKVIFPAFSRLQDQKDQLVKAVEKSLFFLSFLTFPILVGFSVLASDLVKIIPRYSKWEPALFALYLYCINSAFASVSTSMTNLLNAIGKIKITLKLMIMWLVLTWLLMPVLGIKFGYNGIAVAVAIISFSSVVSVIFARKYVAFNYVSTVIKPFVSAILMGIVIYFFKPYIFSLQGTMIIRVIFAVILYLIISRLIIGKTLFTDVSKIFNEFKKNK